MDAQDTGSIDAVPKGRHTAKNRRKKLKFKAVVKASKEPGGPVITKPAWLRTHPTYAANVLAASNATAAQSASKSQKTRDESIRDGNTDGNAIKIEDGGVDVDPTLDSLTIDRRPEGTIKIERGQDAVKAEYRPDAVEIDRARERERTRNAVKVERRSIEGEEIPPSVIDGGYNGPVTW